MLSGEVRGGGGGRKVTLLTDRITTGDKVMTNASKVFSLCVEDMGNPLKAAA